MATFNKVNCFVEDVAEGVHNLSTNTLKAALTDTAPTAASTVWNLTNFPAPVAAGGYTAGGNTLTLTSSSQSPAGTYRLKLGDTVFTATAAGIGPFRYVVLYNDTSATDAVIGYYDYGSSITLANTETFTIDFDDTNGVLTIV
jgi:hypothetical protein